MCDLCGERAVLMGVAGGPAFCDFCVLAILRQLAHEGVLLRVVATIRDRRAREAREDRQV
jgi:hypothetical protein